MNNLYQYIFENKISFASIVILGVILSHLLSANPHTHWLQQRI